MNHKIRPFESSDIPAIQEISKTTWDGHDHLPLLLDRWLDDPLCHPYVLVIDEEVVGIGNVHIIDNGMTGWLEGLRVHEKMREKGFAKIITRHLVDVARQLRVDRIRLVLSGNNPAPQKLARMVQMNPICTWHVFWKDVRQVVWNCDDVILEELHPSEIKNVLKSNPKLIAMKDDPNPYSHSLISHWDVIEITGESINKISEYTTFYFGSDTEDSVFTLGSKNSSGYGPEWCFTIYATSAKAFKSGLSENVEHALNLGMNNILCIHSPEFTSVYEELEWLKERNHELSLVLYERYFKQE